MPKTGADFEGPPKKDKRISRESSIKALFDTAAVEISPKALSALILDRRTLKMLERHTQELVSLGFTKSQALALIARNPELSHRNISRIVTNFENAGFKRDEILKIITRYPSAANKNIFRVLSDLEHAGFSRDESIKLVVKFPPLVSLNISRVLSGLKQNGFTHHEAIELVAKDPHIASFAASRIKARIRRYEQLGKFIPIFLHPRKFISTFPPFIHLARRRLIFYDRLAATFHLSEKTYRRFLPINPRIIFALLATEHNKKDIDEIIVREILNKATHLSRDEKKHLIGIGSQFVEAYRLRAGKTTPDKDKTDLLTLLARHLSA